MKAKIIYLLMIKLTVIFLAGQADASPMPSVNLWGTFDSAFVYDLPAPDPNFTGPGPEWRDISGLAFSGNLAHIGGPPAGQRDLYTYDLNLQILGYLFNWKNGQFYHPVPFVEKTIWFGAPESPGYILNNTGWNMASILDAVFNPDGTGTMSAHIGDLSLIGNWSATTSFHYALANASVPAPDTMLLFGMGMVGFAANLIRRKWNAQ